jgi:hypothetical protein
VNAVGLPDVLKSLDRWRVLLYLATGLELPTASLLLTMAIAPTRSVSCNLSSLTGITGLSEGNSLRLTRHLSELRWLTASPNAVDQVELQLTEKGFDLAMALAESSGGIACARI